MPKMKTHKATAKRIKVTGTGKLMRKHSRERHLLRKKSSRRKRRLSVPGTIAASDVKRIRQLISPGL
ncbi:50S ribosomal protein L35 [bacterium]|nr:50S ribosomal protein L35 [bacterium]